MMVTAGAPMTRVSAPSSTMIFPAVNLRFPSGQPSQQGAAVEPCGKFSINIIPFPVHTPVERDTMVDVGNFHIDHAKWECFSYMNGGWGWLRINDPIRYPFPPHEIASARECPKASATWKEIGANGQGR